MVLLEFNDSESEFIRYGCDYFSLNDYSGEIGNYLHKIKIKQIYRAHGLHFQTG